MSYYDCESEHQGIYVPSADDFLVDVRNIGPYLRGQPLANAKTAQGESDPRLPVASVLVDVLPEIALCLIAAYARDNPLQLDRLVRLHCRCHRRLKRDTQFDFRNLSMTAFIEHEWSKPKSAPAAFQIIQDTNGYSEYFRVFYVNGPTSIRESVMHEWPIKEWLPQQTCEKPTAEQIVPTTPTSLVAFDDGFGNLRVNNDFSDLVVFICDLSYVVVQRSEFVWWLIKTGPKT